MGFPITTDSLNVSATTYVGAKIRTQMDVQDSGGLNFWKWNTQGTLGGSRELSDTYMIPSGTVHDISILPEGVVIHVAGNGSGRRNLEVTAGDNVKVVSGVDSGTAEYRGPHGISVTLGGGEVYDYIDQQWEPISGWHDGFTNYSTKARYGAEGSVGTAYPVSGSPQEDTVTIALKSTEGGYASCGPFRDSITVRESAAVSFWAHPEPGYEFVGWEGYLDGSFDNPWRYTLEQRTEMKAIFRKKTEHTLDLETDVVDGPTVPCPGYITPSTAKKYYNEGETVTLTAAANSGYRFTEWDCDGDLIDQLTGTLLQGNTNQTIQILMADNQSGTKQSGSPTHARTMKVSAGMAPSEIVNSITATACVQNDTDPSQWDVLRQETFIGHTHYPYLPGPDPYPTLDHGGHHIDVYYSDIVDLTYPNQSPFALKSFEVHIEADVCCLNRNRSIARFSK